LASIVHVPGALKLTVGPVREHTEGVLDVRETGSPEDALAEAVYVGPPTLAEDGAAEANLIVCAPLATAKDCSTCGAAS
jgi:hypothetical protein